MDEDGSTVIEWWGIDVARSVTRCKHGDQPCKKCGTTDDRDIKHTTKGGKGKVAALTKKGK